MSSDTSGLMTPQLQRPFGQNIPIPLHVRGSASCRTPLFIYLTYNDIHRCSSFSVEVNNEHEMAYITMARKRIRIRKGENVRDTDLRVLLLPLMALRTSAV